MRANTLILGVGVQVFPVDYFQSTLGLQVVCTGGASCLVEQTMSDPNNTDQTATTTWFAAAAPFNVAITTSAQGAIALFPLRALRFTVTVSGTAAVTILQASGGDGI